MRTPVTLDISGRISIGDPNLACSLWTNGVPLDPENPSQKVKSDHGDFFRWNFMPRTFDGKRSTEEMIAAWSAGDAHRIKFPEDGMSYCMAFSRNRVHMLDWIHRQVPQVLIQSGKQVVLIDENASLRCQEMILGRLK